VALREVDEDQVTLRRRSPVRPWMQFLIRLAVLFALLFFIIAFHWLERDNLKDQLDGHVSFADVIYFTMISATTTGYGDIVPVTERARLFDALIVTPIRIFFILILAGTAYTFVIKQTWNRWLMRMIQKNLRGHVVLAGFGVSNGKALEELLARGTDPRSIVVIDPSERSTERAAQCGVAVLTGDASRDEVLQAAHIERAAALLVSAGRDDSAILIVLTARKLSPDVKISVTIRVSDNEDIARQAGADTVINPVSFAGLLLASSLQGPHRAEYIADLASTEGRVMLRERIVAQEEVGRSLSDVSTGQIVRIIRRGEPHTPTDPAVGKLEAGDRILEIFDAAG
jgi:voltage-gated potassium channel